MTDTHTKAKSNGHVPDVEVFVKPLFDDDAERAVLGAAIVSAAALDEMEGGVSGVTALRAEHFYSETHREIYRSIRTLRDAGGQVDRLTLMDALRKTGRLDAVGGKDFLVELIEGVRSTSNARHHVGIVQRYAGLRAVQQVALDAKTAAGRGDQEPHELQAEVYAALDALGLEPEGSGPASVSDAVSDALEAIQAAYESDDLLAGVPTGLVDLDDLLGGLKDGTMNLVAARPGDGKTTLAGNVIWNATRAPAGGTPDDADVVLFFSLEMPTRQLITRYISMLSGVPATRLDSGEIANDEWTKILQATSEISRRQIWIDDSQGLTVAEMHARARRTADRLRSRGKRLSMIVVDYVGLIGTDRRYENRNAEVSAISRQLKIMAGKMDVPLLVLSQLSRSVMSRADKRPQLEDLRDSGSLEQDAFSVTMIYHDDDDNSDHRGTAELLVRKNRNGKTGMARVAWLPDQLRFASIARPGQVPPRQTYGHRQHTQV